MNQKLKIFCIIEENLSFIINCIIFSVRFLKNIINTLETLPCVSFGQQIPWNAVIVHLKPVGQESLLESVMGLSPQITNSPLAFFAGTA